MVAALTSLPSFGHIEEPPDKLGIDVVVVLASALLHHEPMLSKRIEVFCSSLSRLHVEIPLNIFDARIRMPEQIVQQILTVVPGQLGTHCVLCPFHLVTDPFDDAKHCCCCLGDTFEHADHPIFPSHLRPFAVTHSLQQAITVGLVPGDVAG